MHAFCREMLTRNGKILGRNLEPRSPPHGALIIKTSAHRDHHAAARNPKIKRLVQTITALLHQYVAPGDTQVSSPITHVGRYVRRAYDDNLHATTRSADNQLT